MIVPTDALFNWRLVIFDFDGVLCDSTDECMVTAWNAWEYHKGGSSFRNNVDQFSAEEKLLFAKIRPRVRGAGEYYVLMRSLSEGIEINAQHQFDALVIRWVAHISKFKSNFFNMRDRLKAVSIEDWIDLHPTHERPLRAFRELYGMRRAVIATLKDRDSVEKIMNRSGVFITKEDILDQSQITTKLQALNIYQDRFKLKKNELVFIDDNVTHLIAPLNAGYTVFLSGWGNVLKEYKNIADEYGIEIIE